MSLTPGWKPKPFKAYTPGVPVPFNVTGDGKLYYIDNGSEFKECSSWEEVCEELKRLEPSI
jgi:hypothetical protein